MDFQLTQDQKMLQEAVQQFVAGEYDFESRNKVLATPFGFSERIWNGLAEQGVLGIGLPEAYGGLGGPVEVMVVMEQLGAGLVLEPFLSTVVLGGGLIARRGSSEQQAQILPRMVEGQCRVALAHHEAGARYALDYVNTVARERDGAYVLSGKKTVVLDGATANLLIVSARDETATSSSASSGARTPLSLFLVDPTTPGVRIVPYRTQDGRNAADIELNDVSVAKDRLIAGGHEALEEAIDHAIAALCAEAVGIMEALNAATLEYLKTRVQFGQPIGRSQVLQHRMADMFMMAVQARSMSILATGRCAANAERAQRRHDLSAAKAYIGKAGRFVGQQAVQLHGGMGMSAELIVSHYFKRLTMIGVTFGDVDHHVGVISDQILAESA
ncbi:MAG TPA: acyl-CoA dehydrogenase family protein [Steroidobacteraceae bacterium]|nr:acyl-CoA dehydrogenase family protein [Steroidobacteraceae bacterium]